VRRYTVVQVDAFTTTPLRGNPCAVLPDARGLSDAEMQAIAREMNLSETAFVFPSAQRKADFRFRYFTPATEIPLAGHPTISTAHVLVEEGRIELKDGRATFTMELNVGVLPVEIVGREGNVTRVVMTQKKPEFGRTFEHGEVVPVFGLSVDDLDARFPPQVVSTGTPQLMTLVKSLDVLKRIRADAHALEELCRRGEFFSAHLFCLGGLAPNADTHARHYAPEAGIAEDPFTGSASGGMGAYIVHHGILSGPRFHIEQGHLCGRPGEGDVEVVGSREDIQTVKVGGPAVTVMRGELIL
jgi:trans-2,3-dihydro-3-hydroxyanthranilate isomerase